MKSLCRFQMNMQTLGERDTYTPTDVPQVCSNCDHSLNRDSRRQETVFKSQCEWFKNIKSDL